MSNTTYNYFIEFVGYGKAAGLSISMADYYILSNTNEYFLIETTKLKDICRNKKIVKTKDGSTSGFLISYDIIKNNSTSIKSQYTMSRTPFSIIVFFPHLTRRYNIY